MAPSRPNQPATDELLAVLATEAADDLRLIFKPELLDIVGLSFVTIWELVRQGRFPAPRVIAGRTCWLRSELAQCLQALPKRHYKRIDLTEEKREHPLAARRRNGGRPSLSKKTPHKRIL
jgi:predicted DNA-binding transcriptional regulator AlpA